MKNGTLNTILVGAAIGVGGYIIYKSFFVRERKSDFRGRKTIFTPKRAKLCYCANNDPNKGGYFGDCPCAKGYHDVTDKAMNFSGKITKGRIYGIPQEPSSFDTDDMSVVPNDLNFSGADGNEVIRYKTPTWTVG